MATDTTTAAPIPPKRLRGRFLPGSRASAARLATVSRPVYASIATGIANPMELQVGAVPRSTPFPNASELTR